MNKVSILKEFIKSRRMSIKEIAEKIGMSQQTLNYSLNKGSLDIEEYSKILDILEIPSEWFIQPVMLFPDMGEHFAKTNKEVFKKYPEYRKILEANKIPFHGVINDDSSEKLNIENIPEGSDNSAYLLKLVIEDHEKRIKYLEKKLKNLKSKG